MAKDPGFVFYPGDYLRDTQCLSEKTQVAYDRIMCEHMRNTSTDMNNITVSQDKVDFFSKRLSEDEKKELFTVLEKKDGGYQIYWVAESIASRRSYSESRSRNRTSKKKSHENTSLHMEDEDEIYKAPIIISSGKFSDFNLIMSDAMRQSCLEILSRAQFGTDKKVSVEHVDNLFFLFCETYKDSVEIYRSEHDVWLHFKRWLPKQKINGTKQRTVADKQQDGFDALLEKGKRQYASARSKNS
jgi:hypothetical protein